MSEERETPPARAAETPEPAGVPGAPVEETLASETEVLRAVERAREQDSSIAEPEPGPAADAVSPSERADTDTDDAERAEQERREAISAVDTQLDMLPATTTLPGESAPSYDDLPSAASPAGTAAAPTAALGAATLPPVRDGEIRISADHPMAALYMQTPMPPEIRGNRGAGILISLLATVVFAALYLGAIALWIAPDFPPSQFIDSGLMPWLSSWLFIVPTVAFFVALSLLVLIVGRAGWWAYVLGGFFVALLVAVAATITLSLSGTPYASPQEMLPGFRFGFDALPEILNRFAMTTPVIAAALIAREVSIWFGAWIGARGRRMKLRNAEALAEYETALAEAQVTQP